VDGGTKAFFFSLFADRTTHEYQLLKSLSHAKSIVWLCPAPHPKVGQSCSEALLGKTTAKKADFCGLSWFLNEKNRIKCG
jgi:hypothetical protein